MADQIVCTIAMFLILMGIVIFVYFMTHLQWLQKHDEHHLKTQAKYYHELLVKDEGMRRFRHDVKKHLYAMDALCKEGNLKEVQTYLSELIEGIQEYTGIQTGNTIADCFFNMAIQELEACGEINYDIVGKFPNKMKINHNDFCVLFANAMENAKKALEKVEGERKLILIIRNYQEKIYITLKNTVESEHKEDKEETNRSNSYGLQNMKLVVEKYGGTIEWINKEGFFELNISI